MKKIIMRDEKAYGTLYDLYAKLLYSLILSIVKKREEADDILQEVFSQVWEKASSFDTSRGNVYSWLMTLARNRAIDRLRSKDFRTHDRSISDTDPDALPHVTDQSPLDILLVLENASAVKEALRQIPDEQREVIHIAYFEGYSQSEIATKLNLPLGTVKTRMRQGMKKLQALFVDRNLT